MSASDAARDSCTHCPTRRTFLRDAGLLAAAVAGLVLPARADALPTIDMLQAITGPDDAIPSSSRAPVRYPLPTADGVSIDARNEVILVRANDSVMAFALACPHQNVALRIAAGGRGFQCPKHKSRYQPDGTFISGRATRNMDRYAIERDAAVVIVDTGIVIESDADPARWSAAVVRV